MNQALSYLKDEDAILFEYTENNDIDMVTHHYSKSMSLSLFLMVL